MKKTSPEIMMFEVIKLKEEIDHLSSIITNDNKEIFGQISLLIPTFVPAELGFIRIVSWFYVLYNEVGKADVYYLADLLPSHGLDPNCKFSNHLQITRYLRTYLQHNINPSRTYNRLITEKCGIWIKESCGTALPASESDWQNCLINFIKENYEFLSALRDCIRAIEKDESKVEIIEIWEIRRKRYYPPYKFNEIITKAAADMGRENIDSNKFCNRFYDMWLRELELLHGNYNFENEARKLIEHALLEKTAAVLPITGSDVISFLNIPPGPKVGLALEKAKELYHSKPCSKEELLNTLKNNIS